MMMYATTADIGNHLLAAYQTACEEKNPGILTRSITDVSGEIDDALRGRFVLPLEAVPATLRRICAVLAAYRAVGAITTVLEERDFMYLVDAAKKASDDLEAIRNGKLDVGLEELGEEPTGGTVVVGTRVATYSNLDMRF